MKIDTTSEFEYALRYLIKRFRHIRSDLDGLFNNLYKGNLPGDQVKGTGRTVFKVRVRNTDIQRGKSRGYRVIYYLRVEDTIVLLTIYSKTDQSDISTQKIIQIIKDYEDQ